MSDHSRVVAIVDQDSELAFLRKQIHDIVKDVKAFTKKKMEEADDYSKARQVDIEEVWKKMGSVLQQKKRLPDNYKFADDLRFAYDDQCIVLVTQGHKEKDCDCPICALMKLFGAKK